MGNTPSQTHGSPSRPTDASAPGAGAAGGGSSGSAKSSPNPSGSGTGSIRSTSRHPSLRLPMPSRPQHISPQNSNPTSPSGRAGSPRRRKSLELPDLNKLSFTPAAPVPTTATTTSHHLATPTRHGDSLSPSSVPTNMGTSPSRRWQNVLGGRTASPLAGANLSPMSKVAAGQPASVPEPRSIPIRAAGGEVNPYFPSSPKDKDTSPRRSSVAPIPIPMKGKGDRLVTIEPAHGGVSPPPPTVAPTPPNKEEGDGLVNVPINWTGGGKTVHITGNFADNWRGRIKMRRSTHDFNTVLRLPPGTYQLKFIVDDSWRCSKQIPTAVDDDGTLVNWIEVEPAKTDEELKAEWAMDSNPAVKDEAEDESQWTNVIPAPLVAYQYIEELPATLEPSEFDAFLRSIPYLANVPQPPQLPRILDRVIVNVEPKRREPTAASGANAAPGGAGTGGVGLGGPLGTASPAGLDDNSILAVPNHVVLNHLTASAIKNGTLGVGTTTRYRKKYITTMFFKPTLQDLQDGNPPPPPPVEQ